MKQLVLAIALALIQTNGKTTTLEVKNEAHKQNSNDIDFDLGQNEVSLYMGEMYKEMAGDLSRDLVAGGFYEYSMTPVFAVTNGGGYGAFGQPIKNAISSANGFDKRNAPTDAADCLGTVAFEGENQNGDNYVAYEKSNPDGALIFDTTNPYAARAGFKQNVTVAHDDIRMMQLKNFISKYQTV